MRYLTGNEEELAKRCFVYSVEISRRSNCRNAQHGAIIVKGGSLLGEGGNTPVPDLPCEPCTRKIVKGVALEELCRSVHAEENAILDAYRHSRDIRDAIMYHAKVKEGIVIVNNVPSCTKCSRMILKAGIGGFVLKQKEGFCLYTAEEFNELSYDNTQSHFEDVLGDLRALSQE